MSLIRPERLTALLGAVAPPQPARPQRIPYPSAAGVLYAPPNPDGTRKSCGNCWKWVLTGGCMEVKGEIDQAQVCGYHAFGKPQPAVLVTEALVKISAADAGLIDTPGGAGTSCDLCRFYAPDNGSPGVDEVAEEIGLCNAVGAADGLPPVVVDARGCCARFELR